MGRSKKKQGASLRAKRRADAAAKQLAEQSASRVETARVESKPDDELFVVDAAPDNVNHLARPKKKRKDDGDGKKLPKNRLSEHDERVARKLLASHSEDGAKKLAREGRVALERRRRVQRRAGGARTNYDLWEDDDEEDGGAGAAVKTADGGKVRKVLTASVSGVAAPAGVAPVSLAVRARRPGDHRVLDEPNVPSRLRKIRSAAERNARPAVKVDVASQGQSYRPDPEAHQDAVGEALAVELRREEAREYNRAPVGGGGLSEETRAVMVGSDDDEEESDGDDDRDDGEGDGDDGGYRPHRKREKLTRAQRNKQKRVKAERYALERRRTDRRLLASVHEAKKYAKELARKEDEDSRRRARLSALKAERKAEPAGKDLHNSASSRSDPLRASTVPVALTEELKEGGGALRTVKPKGSLVIDRIESMRARNMAGSKVIEKKLHVGGKRRKKVKGGKEEYVLF